MLSDPEQGGKNHAIVQGPKVNGTQKSRRGYANHKRDSNARAQNERTIAHRGLIPKGTGEPRERRNNGPSRNKREQTSIRPRISTEIENRTQRETQTGVVIKYYTTS